MSKSFLLSLLLLVFPQAYAAEPRVFGAEMPEGEAQPISAVIAAEQALPETAQKFSGRITEVCQNKGCWVMLEDNGLVARVMMHDHAFSVPKDSRGMAVVYGTVKVEELDEKTAKHLAEDAGSDEPAPMREYRIDALSIALIDA